MWFSDSLFKVNRCYFYRTFYNASGIMKTKWPGTKVGEKKIQVIKHSQPWMSSKKFKKRTTRLPKHGRSPKLTGEQ